MGFLDLEHLKDMSKVALAVAVSFPISMAFDYYCFHYCLPPEFRHEDSRLVEVLKPAQDIAPEPRSSIVVEARSSVAKLFSRSLKYSDPYREHTKELKRVHRNIQSEMGFRHSKQQQPQ